MKKELNVTELSKLASAAYSDYVFTWAVTRSANVEADERQVLLKRTAETVEKAETLFNKIETAVGNSMIDEVVFLKQNINGFRKSMNEFKKIYENESEPNA